MVHRLEDASRAGSLARYRNRQSVYQFSELGYRAFSAVEDVLSARIRDANLSRLVFSDILDDLQGARGGRQAAGRRSRSTGGCPGWTPCSTTCPAARPSST